jgi:tetratricopeptide (TPR) repeat protein
MSAIEVMQIVLAREGEQAIHHFRLARLYQGAGQHQAALQAYRDTLQRDPELGGAWLGLAALQRFTGEGNEDWQMLNAASPNPTKPETAMCIAFARGKGCDDYGEYAQAWSHYLEGNRLRQQSQPWDRTGWQKLKDQLWCAPVKSQVAVSPMRKPVFIVGMLRSGTTLLEQLLDQHPAVTARGELNFVAHAWKQWQQGSANSELAGQLGAQIWTHMRQDGPEDGCYIDKNPLNFRFLPLLAAGMPEARILHLQRDGRDSCLSCFMQLFQHPDSGFANQLDDLTQYYQDYLQLMKKFEQCIPGQIFSLTYEDLVNHSERVLLEVQEFLDLPPQQIRTAEASSATTSRRPIRTASTWQARQAIHNRSLGRWRNYYEFAPGFFDRIAELDQQFGSAQGTTR